LVNCELINAVVAGVCHIVCGSAGCAFENSLSHLPMVPDGGAAQRMVPYTNDLPKKTSLQLAKFCRQSEEHRDTY